MVGRSRVEMPIRVKMGKEISDCHRIIDLWPTFSKVLEPEKAITLEVEDHEGFVLHAY